jgi:hypothetical protein
MRNILLFLFVALSFTASAQQSAPCRDVIWLKGGDRFQGKIISYQPDGEIHFQTWNGTDIRMPAQNVRKITQNCAQSRPYEFKERGWYHATRGSVTFGRDYYGYTTGGLSLLHSSGYSLERRLGFGLGFGLENYAMSEEGPASYPIFAEVRGYTRAHRVSPFYVVGVGGAFAGSAEPGWNLEADDWRGGWMALAQTGIRFGNHFTIHAGLRLQRMTRTWDSWNGNRGENRILYRRAELGIGILL